MKKFFLILIEIIFLIIIIFCSIKIFMWWKENKENQKILSDILDESIIISTTTNNAESSIENYEINMEKLKEKNEDCVGYIKINGIDIQYPVVQGENNNFYLSHSFDKSDNSAGWIFLDYRNKLDRTDKNIIIYGHNRRDGSMFGKIKNALNSKWYLEEKNRKIDFITENEKNEYEIFSIYKIPEEEYYLTTDFNDDKSYQDFLNTLKQRSIQDFGIDLSSKKSILTISTCDNNNKYRIVIHSCK